MSYFKVKMHQIWFWLWLRHRASPLQWGSSQRSFDPLAGIYNQALMREQLKRFKNLATKWQLQTGSENFIHEHSNIMHEMFVKIFKNALLKVSIIVWHCCTVIAKKIFNFEETNVTT